MFVKEEHLGGKPDAGLRSLLETLIAPNEVHLQAITISRIFWTASRRRLERLLRLSLQLAQIRSVSSVTLRCTWVVGGAGTRKRKSSLTMLRQIGYSNDR